MFIVQAGVLCAYHNRKDVREMITKRYLYLMSGCALGQLLLGGNPLAAQGDCKVVLEAAGKTQTTPNHTFTTMNMGGKDQIMETIYVPGVIYSKVNGKWSSVTM